jgi:hypothetical protein
LICSLAYVASLVSVLSCDPYERPQLAVTTPERGALIPAEEYVEVLITGPSDQLGQVVIDEGLGVGYREDRAGEIALIKPPAQGLGFMSAELPGDPYLVNRSWLQGTFVPSTSWYPSTLTLRVTGPELNDGRSSIAGLIRGTLLNTELASFVDPIEVDLELDRAQIVIESAVIEEMSLSLMVVNDQLTVSLALTPLRLSYRIEGLINSTGQGHYERVSMNAETSVETSGVTLLNPEVELSPLVVQDDQIPGFLLNPILDALRAEFQATITDAILEVTREVTSQLFAQLRPTLGLALSRPITQETELIAVAPINGGLELSYQTKVGAVQPIVSQQGGGALLAPPPLEAVTGTGASVHIGRPLLNQFAFAAWDAGNFLDLTYTLAELQALGLGALAFPYSNLERAQVDLLLPPIAGWDEGGAYLELGEVQIDLKIGLSKNTKAWTAARVPIRLELSGGGVRVVVDERRQLMTRPIMLNQLSVLAERDEVLKLIHAALPGVVSDVFGLLPIISIPSLQLQGLPNASAFTISPRVIGVSEEVNQWRVDLRLEVD